jgi:putative oxidoreductase
MRELARLRDWMEAHRDLWLDLLRIYFGFALFAKGISFARESNGLFDVMKTADLGYGDGLLAHYVIMVHIVGGLLMAMGLLTRLAAAAQMPVIIGAIILIHRKEGFFTPAMTLEFTILVLALLGLFLVAGSGKFSVEHWLWHRESAPASAASKHA